MDKRMGFWVLLCIGCLATFAVLSAVHPPSCMAQASSPEEALVEEIAKIDGEAAKDASKAEEAITEQLGATKEEIQALVNEKLSYGNIAALLATSSTSGKAVPEVLGMVKGGKKWGEVAAQTGADLGAVLAKVQEVDKKLSGEAVAKPKRKMKFAPGT